MTVPEDDMAKKICHVLTIYPKISPSMMQIALNVAAAKWKPVLEELIAQERIIRSHVVSPTPSGRHQSYTLLSLAEVENASE